MNQHPIREFLSSRFNAAQFLVRLIRRWPAVGALSSYVQRAEQWSDAGRVWRKPVPH